MKPCSSGSREDGNVAGTVPTDLVREQPHATLLPAASPRWLMPHSRAQW